MNRIHQSLLINFTSFFEENYLFHKSTTEIMKVKQQIMIMVQGIMWIVAVLVVAGVFHYPTTTTTSFYYCEATVAGTSIRKPLIDASSSSHSNVVVTPVVEHRTLNNNNTNLFNSTNDQDVGLLGDNVIGSPGACYDMALHACSCDAASCNATLCAAQRMNVWTSDCPNHCNTNECGKEPEQQSQSEGEDNTGGGGGEGNGNEGNSTSDGAVVVEEGDSVDASLVVSSSTTTSWLSHRSGRVRVVLLLSQLCTIGSYL
mmetsp:Transcript_5301/g.5675  ORF Transcript_5301/g.5675 Transcript_5301/m.5675 type:complete len:258 (+) Transcript_5301:2-775(+)